MKGLVLACLLATLHGTAQAYEADIHYSTTYVLARAVGWSQADALIIASANQGVDENPDTVAALEVDATPHPSVAGFVMSSLRQAEKNLKFHCFASSEAGPGRISADVRKVMSGHFAAVPAHDPDPRKHVRRLIALGVALHCQQDAFAHAGFGGSCGPYSGSCFGHTHHTMLDQLVFGVLKKHRYNPDHPGVTGERLLEALQGTASALSAHRPRGAVRAIPTDALVALSDSLRGSGLELPDELRRECNRYIAGRWFHEWFGPRGDAQRGLESPEKLALDMARTCRNPSLGAATVMRIPDARYPRLDSDASPYLVRMDGTYQHIPGGSFENHLPHDAAVSAGRVPGYDTMVRFQLSHWRQLLFLPRAARVAQLPVNRSVR